MLQEHADLIKQQFIELFSFPVESKSITLFNGVKELKTIDLAEFVQQQSIGDLELAFAKLNPQNKKLDRDCFLHLVTTHGSSEQEQWARDKTKTLPVYKYQ